MQYPNSLKERMIQRMASGERVSAMALARQSGIGQPTLSRGLREASLVSFMSEPKASKKHTSRWSPEEKFRIVMESQRVAAEDLGEFLRKHGPHAAQLAQWQQASMAALSGSASSKQARSAAERNKIKALEREILRKDRALAEVTALLALQKKCGPLGGRGRRHISEDRKTLLCLVEEGMEAGARQEEACCQVRWQPRAGGSYFR
ncbi:MAG: transposase [Planctomycetes bacterium]|nr:transposase [Planctomycetota bacterium]